MDGTNEEIRRRKTRSVEEEIGRGKEGKRGE